MYAIRWDYYGNGDKVLASYGTKFAADNWMHKVMGIQLGLTDSLRCTLPEGTDGTGYWKITIHALGYADASYTFEATKANIVGADPVESTAALEEAIAKADARLLHLRFPGSVFSPMLLLLLPVLSGRGS